MARPAAANARSGSSSSRPKARYRYVNDQVIDRAAEKAGVDAKTLAAAEHSEPLVARIVRGVASLSLDCRGFVSPEACTARQRVVATAVRGVV